MNNSVEGFLWWKTKSLSGLSLKVLQDAFLIPYGGLRARGSQVSIRSSSLSSSDAYHQNKVSRIHAD